MTNDLHFEVKPSERETKIKEIEPAKKQIMNNWETIEEELYDAYAILNLITITNYARILMMRKIKLKHIGSKSTNRQLAEQKQTTKHVKKNQ